MPNTVLINPESGLAEQHNPDQAGQLLQSGYHIPLVDQQGNAFAAPYDEAQQLVQSGSHAQPSDTQLQSLLNTAHYNSTEQQAKTLIEGGLRGIGGPAYDYAAPKLGITTPEDIQNRKEHNPGTAALGELVGTVGGIAALPETSLPGIIGKAGQAVSKGIAAEGFVGKAAATFLQGALEGAAYGASHELSEKVLGNPDSTAEHMLSGIGLSAALGGGLNLALTPIISGIEKAIGLGRGLPGRMIGTAEKDAVPGQGFKDVIDYTGVEGAEKEGILKGLTEKVENAPELEQRFNEVGLPVLDSQLSNSEQLRNFDGSIIKAGQIGRSWTGIRRAQEVAEGYSVIKNIAEEAVGADMGMTARQVGDEVKLRLDQRVASEYEPIQQAYKSLKEAGGNIGVDESLRNNAVKQASKIEAVTTKAGEILDPNSGGSRLVKRFTDNITRFDNLDDMDRFWQLVKRDYPYSTISQLEKNVMGELDSIVNDMVEKSVVGAAEKVPVGTPLREQLDSLIQQRKATSGTYKDFKQMLEKFGSGIGKNFKGGQGPAAFREWLSKIDPEKLTDKLFNKKSGEFLEFLSEKFPEEAKLIAALKRSEWRESSLKGGLVDPKEILKKVDGLTPDAKKFVFNGSDDIIRKLETSQMWLDRLPKDINPSNTAGTINLLNLLNPTKALEMAGGMVSDFLKDKTIKQLVRANPADAPLIVALSHLSNLASKTAKQIDKFSGAIFTNPIRDLMGPNRKEEDKGRANEPLKMNKIGLEVMNNANNPNRLIEHLSTANEQLSQYAPDTMNSLSTSVGRAVNFLASKVPSEGKALPFDAPNKPSNMEIAKFNRYADIVENPMHVLQHVRSGTILPQDIETLSMVYPQLYENMKGKITEKMINFSTKKNIPYETRLGLSVFLGQNLDSTMSPMGIQLSQNALGLNRMEQQAKMAQSASPRPSKTGMRQMKSINQDLTAAQRATARHGRDS